MEEKSGSSYVRNDHLQKSLNTKATARFAQLITEYYEKVKRPLSILDFCCGEGEPTFDLFKQLEANKVEIEKVVGYDISEETLGVAKKKNSGSPKLQFIKKNLETEFLEVEQYDAVIVLFGLHCMGNLDKAVESIYRSLKPGGLLLSLTPIEGKELYQMRCKFAQSSRWKSCFTAETSKVRAYPFDNECYTTSIGKLFVCGKEERESTKFEYNQLEFINFLQSWAQEMSDLLGEEKNEVKRDVLSKAYLSEFVDSIPFNLSGSVIKRNNGNITFTQQTHHYEGVKKA